MNKIKLAALAASAAAVTGTIVCVPQSAEAATVKIDIVTANLRFGKDEPARVKRAWPKISRGAEIVFFQEARDVRLPTVITDKNWIILQQTGTAQQRGSALAIKKSAIRSYKDFDLYKFVSGADCDGDGHKDVQDRYIAKATLKLTNGATLRVGSVHMPKGICATGPGSPYAKAADKVVTFANRTSTLTVLGGDWNKPVVSDPNAIGARTGLKKYGMKTKAPAKDGELIDGFFASPRIGASNLHYGPDTNSDHAPVGMTIAVPPLTR